MNTEETRFEFQTETSKKFWEPRLEGNVLTVRFGKIGASSGASSGQTHTKGLSSPEKAKAEYRKLVCEKLAKGYKPTKRTVLILLGAASVQKPEAISSAMMAHHTDPEVADDVCYWLTACLQYGMSPAQFKRTWNRFMNQEDELIIEAFGEWWLECIEEDLESFYREALKAGADRIVWHDQNSYTELISCKGDPGARAIEICALTEKNCKDEKGNWFTEWPPELGPGAPIASMDDQGVKLRGGKFIVVDN